MDSYNMAWNGMCTQLPEKAMFPQQCGSFGSALIPLQRIDFPIGALNSRSALSMRHINMAKFCKKLLTSTATNQPWLLSWWILRLRRPCVKRWRVVAAHSRGTGSFRGCSLANPSYSATQHWQKVLHTKRHRVTPLFVVAKLHELVRFPEIQKGARIKQAMPWEAPILLASGNCIIYDHCN